MEFDYEAGYGLYVTKDKRLVVFTFDLTAANMSETITSYHAEDLNTDPDFNLSFFDDKPSFLALNKDTMVIYYIEMGVVGKKLVSIEQTEAGPQIQVIDDTINSQINRFTGLTVQTYKDYLIIADPRRNDGRGSLSIFQNDQLLFEHVTTTAYTVGEWVHLGRDSEI